MYARFRLGYGLNSKLVNAGIMTANSLLPADVCLFVGGNYAGLNHEWRQLNHGPQNDNTIYINL